MNQSELIEKVAQATELNRAAAGQAVKAVVNAVLDGLVAGEAGLRTRHLQCGGAAGTRGAESTNRRGRPNRSQQGSAVSRRQGRQGCPQSADCEGSFPEEGCTTKEIRAEVNVFSIAGPVASGNREDVYFRADFFGGAAFFREAAFAVGGLRASLTALPA